MKSIEAKKCKRLARIKSYPFDCVGWRRFVMIHAHLTGAAADHRNERHRDYAACRVLENRITFLTPFDIEFERRAGRLVYVPVRELSQDSQTLMLIGRERGTSAIASVLAEMLKTMMQQPAS
jgi:hypothetical protein